MNTTMREAVEDLLSSSPTDDLVFDPEDGFTDNMIDASSRESLILSVLDMSEYYSSTNGGGGFQCPGSRWRSSLDIWRHAKHYDKSLTLPQVMETLYDVRQDIVGHFCPDIKRQVFKLQKHKIFANLFTDKTTEYGVLFSEWENCAEGWEE